MGLYETWLKNAYNKDGTANEKHWDVYIPREKQVYETIIGGKITNIEGTVKELSERLEMPVDHICGFIDGINESLGETIEVDKLEEDSKVVLDINFEKLYKKMVEYKAKHLYELPQWDDIFTPEEQKTMYTEQKKSTTFVRTDEKIGRNGACPCGSGRKYKKCCGN